LIRVLARHGFIDSTTTALEKNDLALLYQEQRNSSEDSTFFKLISRDKG